MAGTTEKTIFREQNGIIILDDAGLTFNTQIIGPTNFIKLRGADYGPGFRMPTISHLISLVYASLENQDYQTAKDVLSVLRRGWLTGNTGILYGLEGMFVQDNPKLISGTMYMNEGALEKMLGLHEEMGVVFSDDRSIRFVPYGFNTGGQTSLELSTNSGVIALVGGEENAERLARASEHYKVKPYFWALSYFETHSDQFAELDPDDSGLRLGAFYAYDEEGMRTAGLSISNDNRFEISAIGGYNHESKSNKFSLGIKELASSQRSK